MLPECVGTWNVVWCPPAFDSGDRLGHQVARCWPVGRFNCAFNCASQKPSRRSSKCATLKGVLAVSCLKNGTLHDMHFLLLNAHAQPDILGARLSTCLAKLSY